MNQAAGGDEQRAADSAGGTRNTAIAGDRALVVRYGELFLKGENRPYFERKLEEALHRALAGLAHPKVTRLHGRFLVTAQDMDEALARTQRVFGVRSVSPVLIRSPLLADISAAAIALARDACAPGQTFKVETRRSDKRFPLPSTEVSKRVGAAIVAELALPVNVRNPDVTIGVEIGTQATFVWAREIAGPGGLPIGSGGRILLLLSGGIDSPVAGWLLQKRGNLLGAVYFHSFPYTGDRTLEKVKALARHLAGAQDELLLHVVPFTATQKALRAAGPANLAVVLYRRMMMRIASLIARDQQYSALATGENLAQVASQTLENLSCIEKAVDDTVLRPLLTNDKMETVALAKQIGTYDVSILPYEDCCSLFVPKHPATRAPITLVEAAERRLDIASLAAECARTTEIFRFGQSLASNTE